MATLYDEEYMDAPMRFTKSFPDSNWGPEGSELDADKAILLMNESVSNGIDFLAQTMPGLPDDVLI